MNEYHKIQTLFKRDQQKPKKPIMLGNWTLSEFEYLANNIWDWTEKVDGTNIRIMYKEERITFGGKTNNAQIPAQLLNRLNEKFLSLSDLFKEMFRDSETCLYGEGYGVGIQKGGGNYRSDQDFVLFDVRCNNWWLERHNVVDIATKLKLDIVPFIGSGTLNEAIEFTKNGFKSCWGDFPAEGIVARPQVELRTRRGDRIITKLKTRDFENLW